MSKVIGPNSSRLESLQTRPSPKNVRSRTSSVADRISHKLYSPNISKHLNNRYQETQSKRQNLLCRLRSRGKNVGKPSLEIESVSSVLENYIMPMFESDIKKKRPPTPKGSVYSTLKLSQRLSFENIDLTSQIESLSQKLSEKDKTSLDFFEKYKIFSEENLTLKQTLETLHKEYTQTLNHFHEKLKNEELLQKQLKTYKEKFEDLLKEKENTQTALEAEKMFSDKCKFQVVQLEHEISILKVANDILGEQVKGLNESNSVLSDHSKILSEFNDFYGNLNIKDDAIHGLEVSLKEMERSSRLTIGHAEALKEIWNNKEKKYLEVLKKMQNELNMMYKSYEEMKEDRYKISEKYRELNRKFQSLLQEYESIKGRFRQVNDKEEKVCKNCYKSFLEAENFNWSCKRHVSAFSGSVYFCCGKTSKEALGCVSSKHEEKDHMLNLENEESSVFYCSSCKMPGHLNLECPKDPNVRSEFPADEELNRISQRLFNANRNKEEANEYQFTLQQRMLMLLEESGVIQSESESEIIVEKNILDN